MASFAPNKIDLSQIHNGQRYQNGDIVSPEAINAPIEASAWAQETADKANKMSEEAVSKAEQALNYGIGNTQGTFPALTAYPIGTFFITRSSTNPAELFGGYWLRIKDRFLLAAGDTYAYGTMGGEATHTLTIDEMPSHAHTVAQTNETSDENAPTWDVYAAMTQHVGSSGSKRWTNNTAAVGGGQAHNNMPPYYAVNAWMRVTEEEFNKNESL